MLLDYIQAAMKKAKYEVLSDDGSYYGHIPPCRGVWANERTLEGCRDELQSVLEDWILIGLWHHHRLPIIDGLNINVRKQQEVA
jgi:predicted RNase H-like HicB family nuclease